MKIYRCGACKKTTVGIPFLCNDCLSIGKDTFYEIIPMWVLEFIKKNNKNACDPLAWWMAQRNTEDDEYVDEFGNVTKEQQ